MRHLQVEGIDLGIYHDMNLNEWIVRNLMVSIDVKLIGLNTERNRKKLWYWYLALLMTFLMVGFSSLIKQETSLPAG